MSKETVKIDVNVLTKQVEDGMKKDALAKHYGIPVSQMGIALKQAGLKIRKFHKPVFELVTEVEEVNATDVNVTEELMLVGSVVNDEIDENQPATEEEVAEVEETETSTEEVTWK